MPNEDQIRQQVREMLGRLVPDNDSEIRDDADIFTMGLDSVGTMLLITEIENLYSLTLTADTIPYDQLRTIAGIASFVAAMLDAKTTPEANPGA